MKDYQQDPEKLLEAISIDKHDSKQGQLKIFFGYAAGVGKTYSMLKAAHAALANNIDVVAGYIEAHDRPNTSALLNGLESLPTLDVDYNGITLHEFDLDAAIKRKPGIILVDELAHTNANICRHHKRYQDIEELLRAGIDVYTTVNVQHIESLCDVVASITGVIVKERIPDSIFDDVEQVKLVDIEPKELIERLKLGEVYKQNQAKRAIENFFTIENLTALREIALRRCADRVNRLTESARIKNHGDYHTDEHILVCLSSSPSNAKIIRTAARMAKAFKGAFTALYVETPNHSTMDEEDSERLRNNIRLASQLGAKIETVYGDNVPYQIAEYARLSGVSKVVIGRSSSIKKHLFFKPSLTEELILHAPNLDIHIIPDSQNDAGAYQMKKRKHENSLELSLIDIGKCLLILLVCSLIGYMFKGFGFDDANIITIYVLGVLIASVVTQRQIYSLIASIVSVLVFNFLFTEPQFTLQAYGQGYPVTFVVMFAAALLTGTLANRLKNHAKKSALAAYHTKVLLDTNQLLQQAKSPNAIIAVTANQLLKLLRKDIIFYLVEDNHLSEAHIFLDDENSDDENLSSANERAVAEWVMHNNKHAGSTTDTLPNAKCLYLAVRTSSRVYAVVGIATKGQNLDSFESSILLSIIGECALALENERNIKEKEEAAVLAKNEQLRANLLRAISHDLRTPLTSISGNASNLISNGDSFDETTKKQLYIDIYDDSMWLINLVENLLSVTRIEEGRLNLNLSENLLDDVIYEALNHVNRRRIEHHIKVESDEEFLLAKMDAKLIVQVIINIVDNAIKYTPKGSNIIIKTYKRNDKVVLSIADDGNGMSKEIKEHVFDMFYCGANKVADSRRSLGLGLALCKSIINAHGGEISVEDNVPHGSIFIFTLPATEVKIHE